MTTTEGSEPAFHSITCEPGDNYNPAKLFYHKGLTARQYAAIQLKVPDSGTPWLDAMIRRARRDEFAGQALAHICTSHYGDLQCYTDYTAGSRGDNCLPSPKAIAKEAYELADALLAEGEKEGK